MMRMINEPMTNSQKEPIFTTSAIGHWDLVIGHSAKQW